MAKDVLREVVPRFKQRMGDTILSGPNNTLLVLGRDRANDGSPDHSNEDGSGAVSIVTGRSTEGFDPQSDRASIHVSGITDVDRSLGDHSRLDSSSSSGVILVGDCVRIRARKNLRIVIGQASITISDDGLVNIEGDVRIGRDAVERALLGESFLRAYLNHTHPATGGPTGPPLPQPGQFLSRNCRLS